MTGRAQYLSKVRPGTLADLTLLRASGSKRIVVPDVVACLKNDDFRTLVQEWIERQLSEFIGAEVRFKPDGLRKFLSETRDRSDFALVDQPALVRWAFDLPEKEASPALLLRSALRMLIFTNWSTYSDCVAAALQRSAPCGRECGEGALAPRHHWKELYHAAFPKHPIGERGLQKAAARGRAILDCSRPRLGLWVSAELSKPGSGQLARWLEIIDLSVSGYDAPAIHFITPGTEDDLFAARFFDTPNW